MEQGLAIRGVWADPALLAAIIGAERPDDGATGAGLAPEALADLRFHAAVHGAAPEAPVPAVPVGGLTAEGVFVSPRWREIWIEAAAEIVACRGRQSPETVRGRLTMIWSRADSRLRARAMQRRPRPPLGTFSRANLRIASVETPYAGYFLTRDYTYAHDLFGGGDSGPLHRAVFVMADAVTVLPYDPDRDRVLVIEQVRASPIARDDPAPWLVEPIAGRIEPGATPEETARQEAREEARLEIGALHPVGDYYPSTGAFSEYLYSFVGIADLPDGAGTVAGLDSEGEDIRSHVMPRPEMMERIAAGEMPVGPLLLTAWWLEAHAARLRGSC